VQRARNSTYYLAASIALAAFIVYLPALRNEFVNWDDDIYVYDNPHIRSLDATFLRWAFLGFHASNWHPLTWISHAVDYAFWGLNPLGHHLTNIILHSINTGLVVVLAVKLLALVRERATPEASPSFLNDRTTLIAAGMTGLLFGLHPLHVESVAWVAERKDLLCALFFLLSIMAYVRYDMDQGSGARGQVPEIRSQESGVRRQESEVGNQKSGVTSQKPEDSGNAKADPKKSFINRHYLLSLGFFILALMSKPMAVSLPLVLLILDWNPIARIPSVRTFRIAIVEKLPFIFLGLLLSVLTVLAQRAEGATAAMDVVPWFIRTLVAAESLVAYLGKTLLPMNLLPFYPYPHGVSLFSYEYLFAIALLLGITMVCIVCAKRQRVWLTAWGYYVVTLIPVIGIVQAGGQSMADRYTYLPSLGPFLIIGVMVAAAYEKAGRSKQRGLVVAFSAAALLVLLALSSLTIRQIAVWRTSLDLWNVVIKKEPDNAPLAYYNRGQVFMNGGQLDKAIEDYSMAASLNPSYEEAFYNRGLAFEKSGQPGRAGEDYERAISLNPSNYQAFNNRGVLYGAAGSYDSAIEYFTRALALNPDYPDAYFNRGITYTLINRRDRALSDFDKAIALNQQFAPAYVNRGKLLLGMDRKGPAAEDFRKACELGIREACDVLP
jgi:protein O-mannosyl-transferase